MVTLRLMRDKIKLTKNSYFYHQRRSTVSSLLLKGLIFIIFWAVTLLVILNSLGIDIDWQNWRLTPTGTIYVASSTGLSEAEVTVNNGEMMQNHLPATFNKLNSANYQVKVEKSGYLPWQKSFEVKNSQVAIEDTIVLVKVKISTRQATDQEKEMLAAENKKVPDQTIIIEDNELYLNEKLVTRFSENLVSAAWYPDGQHIVYQIDDEIRLIEIDGQNETSLVQLSTNDPTTFSFLKRGQELLYQDGDKVLVAELYDY